MKMHCMICKQEREISEGEIGEIGLWIENKKLQSVDYLSRLGLEDGYTCKDGKKHKYEFSEDWDKEVHIVAKGIFDDGKERAENIQKDKELEEKIREMIEQSKELKIKRDQLDKNSGELGEKLKEMTGNKIYEIWT